MYSDRSLENPEIQGERLLHSGMLRKQNAGKSEGRRTSWNLGDGREHRNVGGVCEERMEAESAGGTTLVMVQFVRTRIVHSSVAAFCLPAG